MARRSYCCKYPGFGTAEAQRITLTAPASTGGSPHSDKTTYQDLARVVTWYVVWGLLTVCRQHGSLLDLFNSEPILALSLVVKKLDE